MKQLVFKNMPKRPETVFADLLELVAEFIAQDMEDGECLLISQAESEKQIHEQLMRSFELFCMQAEPTKLRKRCEHAVHRINCIDHGPVGHYEITEYFVRIFNEQLESKKTVNHAS